MNYLQRKKLAFMSIVNKVKGFIRSISGVPPLALEDCVDENSLIDWKLYGNSVQDGTPTPETPIPVVSVGEYDSETGKYKVPVVSRGKNLIPYPYIYTTKTINGVTFTDNGDGSITVNGTATANAIFYLVTSQYNYTLDKCGLKIGDSYTISKTPISGDSIANVYLVANYYNASNSMKPGALATSANISTATIQSDFKSWGIYLLVAKDKTVNNTTIKFQLEKGSTATDYEPYREPIQTNLYLDEPLRKVGDYADYVDFGKGEVVRRVFERELTKDYDYRVYKYTNTNFYGFLIPLINMNVGSRQDGFCTHLNNIPKSINSPIWFGVNEYAVYMSFPDIYNSAETDAERVTAFKAYLTAQAEAGTPVKVTYILAEETHTPITIPKLPTIKGTTIYEIGTSLNASNMEATYYSTSKGG